jgi:tritrans,polycis-undecaprenyl-diphosphate synthase [geranylgeranyl-diphosphate specific]
MNELSHLAVIIDGNRRYAKKGSFPVFSGHEKGAENVEKMIEWCSELNLKELTFYALSIENLKRDRLEVDALLDLMRRWFKKLRSDSRIKKKNIRMKFVGRLSLLPKDVQELMMECENEHKENSGMVVNFCVAYGGRQEITDAVQHLVKNNLEVTEENIQKNLYLQSEPDLIIRTGKFVRTSNFLPWQAVYSEWIFLEKLWPEFTKKDLLSSIEIFKTVKRNFGE